VSTSALKALVQQRIGLFGRARLEEYLQFYAPDAQLHFLPPGLPPGRDGARAYYQMVLAAFPDGRVRLEDLVAEDDKVACRFLFEGTHEGDFMGVPPTGNRVALRGITIIRVAGNQCVERWSEADFLGLLQQLGALPARA
jgi:predicted ester cyclase